VPICEELFNKEALRIILRIVQVKDVLPNNLSAKNCQSLRTFIQFFILPFIGIQHDQDGSIIF